MFPNLYIAEHLVLINMDNQLLKNNDKIPPYLTIIFPLKISVYVYHWLCFTPHLRKFIHFHLLVCILLNNMLTNSGLLHVFKTNYQFSFMIVLTANWNSTKRWIKPKLQFCLFRNCQRLLTIVSLWLIKLQDFFNIYHTAKQFYKFQRNFILNTLIWMIHNRLNSVKLSLRMKLIMLHIKMMSEIIRLRFGLDWNLKPICKDRNQPNFQLILGKNWMLHWMICKKIGKVRQKNSTTLEQPFCGTTFLNWLIIIERTVLIKLYIHPVINFLLRIANLTAFEIFHSIHTTNVYLLQNLDSPSICSGFVDILVMSSTELHMIHMVQLIKQLDELDRKEYLKNAPETYFCVSHCKLPRSWNWFQQSQNNSI